MKFQVDESVVRNTRDVDIILNEPDLDLAIPALEAVGFIYRRSAGVTMFLDGPDAKARDAVQVVFAGKKVREEYNLLGKLHRDLRPRFLLRIELAQ